MAFIATLITGYGLYARVNFHFNNDAVTQKESTSIQEDITPVKQKNKKTSQAESKPAGKTKDIANNNLVDVNISAGKNDVAAARETTETAQLQTPQPPKKIKAIPTVFKYNAPSAEEVLISGTFSAWRTIKMEKKNGVWTAVVYILPGTYPFHYVVDGVQKPDPDKPASPTGDSLLTVVSEQN